MEVNLLVDRNPKPAGVDVLIANKIDSEPKQGGRDKDVHFILIKGTIYQENRTFVNIHTLNIQPSKL